MANPERASTRRLKATASLLSSHPEDIIATLELLEPAALHNLGAAIEQVQVERALASGDLDAIIDDAFDTGFGSDGLAVLPWVTHDLVVCPGGLVARSQTNHKCRFVSVNDCWVWESQELVREDKRSSPGKLDGFRAVALLPVIQGTTLDVVSGKARAGQHSVDRVVSFKVDDGELVEVAQRTVASRGMR